MVHKAASSSNSKVLAVASTHDGTNSTT